MNSVQPVTSTPTTTVQRNRAIIELRSIADHCACTTAWTQRSWSFDRPVRNGDVIKVPSCALARTVGCRPVENRKVWTSPSPFKHSDCKIYGLLQHSQFLILCFLWLTQQTAITSWAS